MCRHEVLVGPDPVAAAGMDESLAVLETGLLLGPRQRGRRREVEQGALVVAEQGQEIAQGAMQLGDCRMAEGQRGLEMLPRLGIGEHHAGLVPGPSMRLGRRGRLSGQRLVPGDQRPALAVAGRAGQRGERRRDPTVEQSPAGEAEALVDDVAQSGVREVEAQAFRRARLDLPYESSPGELLESFDRLVVAPPARGPDEIRIEGSADDRRRRQDLAGDLVDRGNPGSQQRLHAAGSRGQIGPRIGQGLDHVERQTLGILEQGVDPGLGRGRSEHRADERRHLRPVEPAKAHPVRESDAGGQIVDALPDARLQVLDPPGHQQSDRMGLEPSREIAEELHGRRVGEVQVVDPDETRSRTANEGRQDRRQRGEQADPAERVGVQGSRQRPHARNRQQASDLADRGLVDGRQPLRAHPDG